MERGGGRVSTQRLLSISPANISHRGLHAGSFSTGSSHPRGCADETGKRFSEKRRFNGNSDPNNNNDDDDDGNDSLKPLQKKRISIGLILLC